MNIKRTNKLKTNSSGFGHIEMLLLVVAVVVIGGVGFFVYQNQNKKTASKSTAHAGGWNYGYIGTATNGYYGVTYTVKACRILQATGFGKLWSINTLAAISPANATVASHSGVVVNVSEQHNASGGYTPQSVINTWWANSVGTSSVWANPNINPVIWWEGKYNPDGISNNNGGGVNIQFKQVSSINNC